MDHRSALVENEIQVDQAIFTSLPSLMGEGYRLVAASPGLKPDEKTEIIRCSPSHNSLCSESFDSKAFAVYLLSSGRVVIASSRLAGREHTARGGERIYTHLVVLNHDEYKLFAFNPLQILQAIDQTPNLKLEPRLNRFSISLPEISERGYSCEPDETMMNHLCLIVSSLLKGQRLIVSNSSNTFALLKCLLNGLSLSLREKITFSFGLNYSPSRNFQIIFLEQDDPQTRRLVRGQNIEWLNLQDSENRVKCPILRWLKQT